MSFHLRRGEETAEALKQIHAYMLREGREPFVIVTPTDCSDYYQSVTDFL